MAQHYDHLPLIINTNDTEEILSVCLRLALKLPTNNSRPDAVEQTRRKKLNLNTTMQRDQNNEPI